MPASFLWMRNYPTYRVAATALNILLLAAFALTAFCGMSMSGHAVPFLYGMTKVSFARKMHLSMSHWAFVLMGLHLGFRIPAMAAKLNKTAKTVLTAAFAVFLNNMGITSLLYDHDSTAFARLWRGVFSVRITQQHEAATDVVLGDAPLAQQRLPLGAVEGLLAARDDAGSNAALIGGKIGRASCRERV